MKRRKTKQQRRNRWAADVFHLRNQGLTYREITGELGISHQTIWKAIHSNEYERLVVQLEGAACAVHDAQELFWSTMREAAYVDVYPY